MSHHAPGFPLRRPWSPGPRRRPARAAWAVAAVPVALSGCVVLAALLRLPTLASQSLWYDEAVTSWLLRGSPGQMLHALPHSESTPPVYYLLAWGWVRLAGRDELGLRSLSAAAGIATVPVAYAAARELAGRRAGLIAALLVAVSPMLVWYSQEARSYALLVLLSTASLWLMARARSRPTAGRLVGWAVVAALALWTHYFALFVVAPEALLLMALRGVPLRRRLAGPVLVALLASPLPALALTQRTRTYWFLGLPLARRVGETGHLFLVGFRPPATTAAFATAAAAVAVGLVLLAVRADAAQRRGALVAGVVGVGAVAVPVGLALAGTDYVNGRNLVGALVPLLVVVAAGLGARRAGILGVAATAAIVAASFSVLDAAREDRVAQRPGFRQVATVIGPAHGRRAILLDGSRTWARPLGVYLPRTWWMPRRGAPVTEVDVVRREPTAHDCPDATWWGAACDVGPRPPITTPPARGFRAAGVFDTAGFEVRRWRSARPVRIVPLHGRRSRLLLTPVREPTEP